MSPTSRLGAAWAVLIGEIPLEWGQNASQDAETRGSCATGYQVKAGADPRVVVVADHPIRVSVDNDQQAARAPTLAVVGSTLRFPVRRWDASASPTEPPDERCPAPPWSSGHPKMTMQYLYGDNLAVEQPWTADLQGGPITSGHHVAEDAPEALSAALINHFAHR